MNNTPNNNDPYAFKKLLNTENLQLLYTQMLNAVRFDKHHNAVYVFDEVGCGKTVSAIMAIAKTIWDKENNIKSDENQNTDTHYHILVITPKSVCPQFKTEILDKLKFDEDIPYLNNPEKSFRLNRDNVKDVSNLSGETLINDVKSNSYIVIANPHKMCKLTGISWDLIVVDEAHDIVCNSKKQTEEFHKRDKITRVFEILQESIVKIPDESIQKAFNEHIHMINCIEDGNRKDFIILVHAICYNELICHFNKHNMKNIILLPENRTDIKLYRSLLDLSSQRVMFLSATPYKNSKEPDFFNYMYAAIKITPRNLIFSLTDIPDLNWVEHLYKKEFKEKDLQQFENSNTSMLFKEVANSIPFVSKTDISTSKKTESKRRFIGICKTNDLNQLPSYLVSLNNNNMAKAKDLFSLFTNSYTPDKKNRIIIFVSCSAEGEEVFEKIFPGKQGIISQDECEQHTYTDHDTKITCEFVMNKFGNTKYLNRYSKEPTKQDDYTIPDILIVTWQVAQVGVNLPTFNHVIHYNISQLPGSIEQRFGRIDRMTTKMNNLHNIYCFDEGSTSHHNLSVALENYMSTLVNGKCNLPVKNILLCPKLGLPQYNEDKTMEYIKIYTNTLNALDFNPEDENFKGEIEDKIKDKINKINDKLKSKELSPIAPTISNQSNLKGMYCDEIPEMLDNSKNTDKQKTKDCTIEAVNRFLKMIEELLDTLDDQEGFNDRIDKINDTTFDAGDIIYAGSNNNESSETDSDSTVKNKIKLEDVVENINRVCLSREN